MTDRQIAEQTGQVPSIGRIVHFTYEGGTECHAALVRRVTGPDSVDLKVFWRNGGDSDFIDVPMSDSKEAFTWHWPERVP